MNDQSNTSKNNDNNDNGQIEQENKKQRTIKQAVPGDRVGAILSAKDNVVEWLGWGIYQGDKLIPGWEALAAELLPMQRNLLKANLDRERAEHRHRVKSLMQLEQRNAGTNITPTEEEIDAKTDQIIEEWKLHYSWDDETLLKWVIENTGILRNPCIELENGDQVWGSQCWWSIEESMQKKMDQWVKAGWEIKEVTIKELESSTEK